MPKKSESNLAISIKCDGVLTRLEKCPVYVIARYIRRSWVSVNYAAEPYLAAMATLEDVDSTYGYDSGKSIVAYFLANASSWRGDTARAVKAELRRRIKA